VSNTRHRWTRTGVHRHRCQRCGLERVHEEPAGPGERWTTRFERGGAVVARGRTPTCPGHPPAEPLRWTKSSDGPWQDADTGHRVTATRGADGWRFVAWGPDQAAGWSYRDWSNGKAPHWSGSEPKARYAVGEHIPQRRVLLGVADTADEARDLCAADAQQQREAP
jgi:hypothetical protein